MSDSTPEPNRQMPRLKIPDMYFESDEQNSDVFYDAAAGIVSVIFESSEKSEAFEKFCNELSTECLSHGMQVVIDSKIFDRKSIKRYMRKINVSTSSNLAIRRLIIIISDDYYWKDKSVIYEHRFAVPVQWMKSEIFDTYEQVTLRTLSMQVNVKLGGINYRILDVVRKNVFSNNVPGVADNSVRDFADGDLIVAFNARKFNLPQPFAANYKEKCKELWTVGYSANCIKDKPMTFVSNTRFMSCRSYELGKHLNYDVILKEILETCKKNGTIIKRIFLIFTADNLSKPLPLYGVTAQFIKVALRDDYESVPTVLMSYNKDDGFVIPEGVERKIGSVLKMQKFFGRNASLDIRFVASCEEVDHRPHIARICTIDMLNTPINCLDLAQFVFNLCFCRQTADLMVDPIPAPVFYAMEIANRSQQLFLAQVKNGTSNGDTRHVIDLCNEKFTYASKTGLSTVNFAF